MLLFSEAGTAALRRGIDTKMIILDDLEVPLRTTSERAIYRVLHEGSLDVYERFNKANRIA